MAQTQKTEPPDHIEKVVRELEMLRRLAIVNLSDRGFSQADIADALAVSQPTISRMFPKGIPKRKDARDE